MILTKTFRFLITILLLAEGNLACAGITGDDLINKILETTLKTGADIYGRQYVSRSIEKFVTEKFGIPFSGRVGQALAIYDANQALDDYGRAKNLSEKSEQADRIVADGITVFHPAVGMIIQLSLLGKKILTAIATKELILKNMELQVQLSREATDLYRRKKIIIDFELNILEDIKNDLFKIGTSIDTLDNLFRTTCLSSEFKLDLQSTLCLEMIDEQLSLATFYKFRIQQLFNLPTQYIKIQSLFKREDAETFSVKLAEKTKLFDVKKDEYLKWRRSFIEQKQIQLQEKIEQDAIFAELSNIRKCQQIVSETLNTVLKARKSGDFQGVDEIINQTKKYYYVECRQIESKINRSTQLILAFLEGAQ